MFNFLFLGRSHQLNLDGMHSAIGTRIFKRLSPTEQQRWSAYDRNMSRMRMKRMMNADGGGRKGRSINLLG